MICKRSSFNAYYVLMTRGMLGTYLYVCDPALKEYLVTVYPGDIDLATTLPHVTIL